MLKLVLCIKLELAPAEFVLKAQWLRERGDIVQPLQGRMLHSTHDPGAARRRSP